MRWVFALSSAPLAAVLLLACLLSGCGGAASATACGSPHHDPFDPRSVTHILPGFTPPPYLTDPATSGEHQPVNLTLYRGAHASPVTPQIQVALLESSLVLVQYRSPALLSQLAPLESFPLVTLAPNPGLPTAVAASAWLWHMTCGGADLTRLRAFVLAHQGNGPQLPPKPS